MTVEIFTLANPLYSAYIFYVSVLILKVFFVVFLIGKERHSKHVFISPEDTTAHPKAKLKPDDPDVERVRRAHANDLENIPLFAIVALLYITTGPSYTVAVNLFRLYTFARFAHTFVYAIVVVPQPSRAIAFGIGFLITIYMALTVILSTLTG